MKLSDIPMFSAKESEVQAYAVSLKKMSVLSSLILIVYPFLLVFLVAFFIGNAYRLSAIFVAYWLMFLALEQRRYRLDFRMRGVSATFWNYVVHSPFSQSYFKFSVLPVLIFFGEITGYYVKMTAYEGAVLIVLVMAILAEAPYLNPWLRKQSKHARPLNSENIISRLNDVTLSEGIPQVIPKIIDGKTYRVANAYTVGIFKPVIYITDYAVENMSEEEVVIILTREISHVKRRDGLKVMIPSIFATLAVMIMVGIVAYWSTIPSMIQFLQKIMPQMVVAWVIIILAGLIFVPDGLRKRSETEADKLAVDYSSPDSTVKALVKLTHLNQQPVAAFSPMKLSLLTRIMKINGYAK
jgi:Zn-dependent protease with chaperone function